MDPAVKPMTHKKENFTNSRNGEFREIEIC